MNSILREIVGRESRIISYTSPEDSLLRRLVINSIELSTGRQKIERAYEELISMGINDVRIWDHVFPLLNISLDYNEGKLREISTDGPLIVIANHPYGVADGLALGYLLSRLRNDFYLVVNEVLCQY